MLCSGRPRCGPGSCLAILELPRRGAGRMKRFDAPEMPALTRIRRPRCGSSRFAFAETLRDRCGSGAVYRRRRRPGRGPRVPAPSIPIRPRTASIDLRRDALSRSSEQHDLSGDGQHRRAQFFAQRPDAATSASSTGSPSARTCSPLASAARSRRSRSRTTRSAARSSPGRRCSPGCATPRTRPRTAEARPPSCQ